ncbi:M48 family metalloprotease [Phaeacidiphilus oryzae]|uniref:M48 family metalloprotease n=1 Tax=Phaeacidiphilus oryzae TaxID=348818 RepID=UPI0009FBC89A|nr:M48 family metalloprotease [Phaeacidiphilus oryzae]
MTDAGAEAGAGAGAGSGAGAGPGGGPAAGADEADFTPEQTARARALRRAAVPVALGGRTAGLALSALLGFTGAGPWLTVRAGELLGGGRQARIVAGAVVLLLAGQLLGLPFAARGRVVRQRFGLVTQGWAGWWVDVARGFALSAVLGIAAAEGVYALAGWSERWWWLPAAGAAAVLAVVMSFLWPLLVEPLFNRFTPMPEGGLRGRLLELAERQGVRVRDVLVADASRRTTALNAYVSGLGATRRIVVYDTLLATAAERDVELVVAHELGHVVHRDVTRGMLLGALGAAAAVCVVGPLAGVLAGPVAGPLAGDWTVSDPRSMALLMALAALGGAVAGPVQCAVSRRIERRADVFALDATRDPEGFIAMQRALTVANVAEPDPPRWLSVLFGTHPTPSQRVALARGWARGGARR